MTVYSGQCCPAHSDVHQLTVQRQMIAIWVSRVVGAGLRRGVLDDAAQAKPPAGPRIHDEGVIAELALQVQAACTAHIPPLSPGLYEDFALFTRVYTQNCRPRACCINPLLCEMAMRYAGLIGHVKYQHISSCALTLRCNSRPLDLGCLGQP